METNMIYPKVRTNRIHTKYGDICHAPIIKKELEQAKERIAAGINDGSLTGEEADALYKQLDGTWEKLLGFKENDGRVDSDERKNTRDDLAILLQEIYDDRHNKPQPL